MNHTVAIDIITGHTTAKPLSVDVGSVDKEYDDVG